MRGKKARQIRSIARDKLSSLSEKANRDLYKTIYIPGSPSRMGFCFKKLSKQLKQHYLTVKRSGESS